MTIDPYLADLIDRMTDRSDSIIDMPDGTKQSNSHAKFYNAYIEAKALNNTAYFEQLKHFIEKTKKEDLKQKAYAILISIYANTGEESIINYVLDRLAVEQKEWTLHTILFEIEHMKNPLPSHIFIDNILHLTTNKKHIVRDNAITCLKNTNNTKAEEKLIEIISHATDPFQLTYANGTLAKIGTQKSIPYLQKLTNHKQQNVAASALGAILKLSDSSYLPLFIEHLENGKLKYLGLEGVIRYGDKDVVPIIEKRVKELVSKKRAMQLYLSKDETELTFAMRFLTNYVAEFNSIKNLYQLLITKKAALLWNNEIQWLNDNKKSFE
ncbi:MAG: HEAT repeat domain-containing protein [Bacteroidota bacterium]